MRLESIQPAKPFQAEYEGLIPFTRSKVIASDRTPCRQARMARFDETSWVPFGDVVTIESDEQN
jgi:hypothetical protein